MREDGRGAGPATGNPGGRLRGVRGEGFPGRDDQEYRRGGGGAVARPALLVFPEQGGAIPGDLAGARADPPGGDCGPAATRSATRGGAAADRAVLPGDGRERAGAALLPSAVHGGGAAPGDRQVASSGGAGAGPRLPHGLPGATGRVGAAASARCARQRAGVHRDVHPAAHPRHPLPDAGRRRRDERGAPADRRGDLPARTRPDIE
jgi:hypothetical protein